MSTSTSTTAEAADVAAEVATAAPEQPATPKRASTKKDAPAKKARKTAAKAKTGDKAAPKAAKASKSARAKKNALKAAVPSEFSKKAIVLDLIRRKGGATLAEIMTATDWQAQSVRGFISGTVGKRMGLAAGGGNAPNSTVVN